MTLQEIIEEMKLELTGGLLELEIPDETLAKVVNKCLRTLRRYIDTPKLITVPYAPCIDFSTFEATAITGVYRTEGYGYSADTNTMVADPMYLQQWLIFSNGGSMYNLQDYVLNFSSYNTLLQMRNTLSTDLAYRQDINAKKLYINVAYDKPLYITIEYIPFYNKVEDIESVYWQDILCRLAIAETKIILGRIRTRFTQSNALWTQDGNTMLEEGNTELKELTDILATHSTLMYPID